MTNRSRAYRIGLIVPSSNTTMETELPAMFGRRRSVAGEICLALIEDRSRPA